MEKYRVYIGKRVLVASPISILFFLTNGIPIILDEVMPAFPGDRRKLTKFWTVGYKLSCWVGIPGQFL